MRDDHDRSSRYDPMCTPPSTTSWYSREVGLFLALAFTISWGAWALRHGLAPSPLDRPLALVTKFGPSAAGLIAAMVVAGRHGLVDLLRRLSPLRVGIAWILFALGLPIALGLAAMAIWILSGREISMASEVEWVAIPGIFAAQLALRFFAGGGLGEELGWRGFMLPRLQLRLGWIPASVAIGIWHGLWHLPAQGAAVLILLPYTIAGSLVFTWIATRTGGNLFLAALLHASGNATLFAMEEIWPPLDDQPFFQLAFLLSWIVLAIVLVIFERKAHDSRLARETAEDL